MTKQRKWQLSKMAAGCCQRCGRPSPGKVHCEKCARADGTKRRSMLRSEWAAVDWTRSNIEIARLVGRTEAAVRYQRTRRAVALCAAAILDHPNEAGWWWAWTADTQRWYLLSITPDDLSEDPNNVPISYDWWTKCVPPAPPARPTTAAPPPVGCC